MKIQALGTKVLVEAVVRVANLADQDGNYRVLRDEGDDYKHYRVKVISVGAEVEEVKVGDYVRISFELLERRMIHRFEEIVLANIDQREVEYKEVAE